MTNEEIGQLLKAMGVRQGLLTMEDGREIDIDLSSNILRVNAAVTLQKTTASEPKLDIREVNLPSKFAVREPPKQFDTPPQPKPEPAPVKAEKPKEEPSRLANGNGRFLNIFGEMTDEEQMEYSRSGSLPPRPLSAAERRCRSAGSGSFRASGGFQADAARP